MKKFMIATFVLVALISCRRDEVTKDGIEPSVDTIQTETASADTAAQATSTQDPPPPDAAPAPTAVITEGQPIYRAHCDGCHGPAGRTPAGGVLLASEATQSKPIDELARLIRVGNGEISRTAHPQIGLTDDEIHKVAAYVKAMN